MIDGWPHDDSPFHQGEQKVQDRFGVRESMETFARQVVRDHLPRQHRHFYESLQFVALGTVDTEGRPWASIMAGRRGFMTSPDADTLDIAGQPLFGDPLKESWKAGAPVGVLGIELETRRRNRIAGRIRDVGPQGVTIAVDQAFGNCPQYIQRRSVEVLPQIDDTPQRRPVHRSPTIDARARKLIERSDTLFIATAYIDGTEARSQGADVSHRGGKPGFVKVEDERCLIFPDFSGNNHFNTIGNILVNPKAGLLFVDFEAGDLIYLTGEAHIIWDGEDVRAFDGADRFVRFRCSEVIRAESSLPLRFDFRDYSPALQHTGSWGPATVIKGDRPPQPDETRSESPGASVPVRFSTSNVDTVWSPAEGTILELAEKAGLAPRFACRSGVCGTCATQIRYGQVDYVEDPIAPHNADEVLICRAVPRTDTDGEGCGEDPGLVIEL